MAMAVAFCEPARTTLLCVLVIVFSFLLRLSVPKRAVRSEITCHVGPRRGGGVLEVGHVGAGAAVQAVDDLRFIVHMKASGGKGAKMNERMRGGRIVNLLA